MHDWRPPPAPPLGARAVHVWRVRLDAPDTDAYWPILSADEQERARRFHFAHHRDAFVVAHGALRHILAGYLGDRPESLAFAAGENGKPALVRAGHEASAPPIEFNLSHSGDLALVAVSAGARVGVDVERWDARVEHLDLAEHFFSPAERRALRALAAVPDDVVAGFFAAWSRKEAYLKATGDGVVHGLDHFDVSLAPNEPVRLLADARDAGATTRWTMTALAAGPGYSAALVAEAPVDEIVLLDGVP